MIKIELCPIPEAHTTWEFVVLDDNEPITVNGITKPANQWTKLQRPLIKSEVTAGLVNSFNAQRLVVIKENKKPDKLKGRTIIKETKHALVYNNNSVDTIQFPCPDDITKIKTALNL